MSEHGAISVSGLEVTFGRNQILKGIDLHVPEGSLVGLLGPSGSGKTTLVKSIIGMNRLSKGEVRIFGEKMPNLTSISKIGYMAQSDALYEDLSAMDNLVFFGSLLGMKGKTLSERASELLDFVDLSADRKKLVHDFSGGMKRRLSLAITLMHRPKLLILDEPTVGIDPVLRRKFWDEFTQLIRDGATILITTHVMDEAYHCSDLVLLRDGAILASGSLEELFNAAGSRNVEDLFFQNGHSAKASDQPESGGKSSGQKTDGGSAEC